MPKVGTVEILRMRLGMKRSTSKAIAVDLGASGLRAVQLDETGQSIHAACESPLHAGADRNDHHEATGKFIHELASDPRWNSRTLLLSMPSTLVTMMPVELSAHDDPEAAVQARLADARDELMVRHLDVTNPRRSNRGEKSLLCIAMPKAEVLRYVEMIHEHRLKVAGVYAPASLLIRAFRHIHRRMEDGDAASLYLNLDPTGITMAVGQGSQLVAARSSIGSCIPPSQRGPQKKHIREHACVTTDVGSEFMERRHGDQTPSYVDMPDDGSSTQDCNLLLDEVRMCLRQYQMAHSDRPVQRLIFTGPGASHIEFCRDVAQSLAMPAHIGDPMSQWEGPSEGMPRCDWANHVRPQWSIVAGLIRESLELDDAA